MNPITAMIVILIVVQPVLMELMGKRRIKGNKNLNYICKFKLYYFIHLHSLHQHELKLNTVENPFECSKCNNPYRSGSTMWKCFQCNFEICIKCRYI